MIPKWGDAPDPSEHAKYVEAVSEAVEREGVWAQIEADKEAAIERNRKAIREMGP